MKEWREGTGCDDCGESETRFRLVDPVGLVCFCYHPPLVVLYELTVWWLAVCYLGISCESLS